MTLENICDELVDEFQARPTLRAGSLITTMFGDSIAPRGGVVWLGSLIKAMSEFGISERLVRTSVFRLAKDGWLQSKQIGRRSFYSLSDDGRERFAQATHRIYGEPASSWNEEWCMVFIGGIDTATKEKLRKEMAWLGFGAMSANLLAHPAPDLADLDITLRRLNLADQVIVMTGRTIRGDAAMRRHAHSCWNLDEIDAAYEQFVGMFRPVLAKMRATQKVDEKTAFVLRTFLIQEYRKVLLRDPQLPTELLPDSWHGATAYQLCRNLYIDVYKPADNYLSNCMESADGPLPPAASTVMNRFGGLERR